MNQLLRCRNCGARSRPIAEGPNTAMVIMQLAASVYFLSLTGRPTTSVEIDYARPFIGGAMFLLALRWAKVNFCLGCRRVGTKSAAPDDVVDR